MKKNLYICVKNPFCNRDVKRMGLEELESRFHVIILDCTSWLMPKALETREAESFTYPSLHRIHSFREFCRIIREHGVGLAVDYVGQFSVSALLMFAAFKFNGTKIIVIDSGSFPTPEMALGKKSKFAKLYDAIHYGIFYRIMKEKIVQILLKLLPNLSPDYALVAGSAWKSDNRFVSAKLKLPAHSFDYEVFRNIEEGSTVFYDKYAVYIDETIVGHEDNEELDLPQPASPEHFYVALRKYFDWFEAETGVQIVIAGYPSAKIENIMQFFGGRKAIIGETAELIRYSTLVFAHASTAISYAVLWKKPIIFLTSDEIKKSWYQPWIDSPRLFLNAKLINIDDFEENQRIESWKIYDEAAYLSYEQKFIKSANSPEMSLWSMFSNLNDEDLS